MENSMKNQASIYRLTSDGKMQMVMGSPDQYFNREKGNYLSETLHAFSNSTELGCMQYIWRATEYNGKLLFGTFDASTLNHYFTFLTNGDLIGMDADDCEHQIRSAVDLINLLKKETVIDSKTTDMLVQVLGTLNSMVNKKATEASVKQLLEISLQFKKAFDKIRPILDKIVNSDLANPLAISSKASMRCVLSIIHWPILIPKGWSGTSASPMRLWSRRWLTCIRQRTAFIIKKF